MDGKVRSQLRSAGDLEVKVSWRLVAELESQFAESAKLEAAIRANLKSLNINP